MKLALKFAVSIVLISVLLSCNHSKKIAAEKPKTEVATPLQGIYWQLSELMGQPINSSTNGSREAFIRFNPDGKTVSGNGGCNGFGGNYDRVDSSHLKFGPLMSTKMYCEEAKFENLYLDVLSKADNFYINSDTLFLRNAGMDSTAKFVANYLKKAENN